MEDTLRYFFSAVFQGFAAVMTLSVMFTIYRLDKFQARKENLELQARELMKHENINSYLKNIVDYDNVMDCLEKKYLPGYAHVVEPSLVQLKDKYTKLLNKYNQFHENEIIIKKKMKIDFFITSLIMIFSLICLFLVEEKSCLIHILVYSGIFIIFLSLVSLLRIFSLFRILILVADGQ